MNPPDGKWCVAAIGDDLRPWTAFKWGDHTDRSVQDFRTWRQAMNYANRKAAFESALNKLMYGVCGTRCNQSHWELRA